MSPRSHDAFDPRSRRIAGSDLGRLAPAIDEKTGIVRRIDILLNCGLDPDLFCAVAQDASVRPILGRSFDNRGAAAALTRERAAVRAAGECIERYCSAFYNSTELLEASAAELHASQRAFHPTNHFYPFDARQYVQDGFPFLSLNQDTRIRWATARNLHHGHDVLVPASCVYLPYLFESEPITHAPISTGLAAGTSVDWCVEKGAAEIVERDCLMICWKARKEVQAIDVATCLGRDPRVDRLIGATRHLPGRWYLHLLTLDIEVPVVSAAFINDTGLPLTSFGISANRDFSSALRGALEEALLSRFLLNRAEEVVNASERPAITFRTLRDHLFGHATCRDLQQRFFEIFQPEPTLDFDTVEVRFTDSRPVVDAVRDSGLSVLYIDVTPPDVAALGVSSIRVLIPGAEPLDPDHEAQHLGGTRLRAANANMGTFNSAPHPFP